MGISKTRKKIPSTYPEGHIIFDQYNQKYCANPNSPEKIRWENSLRKSAQRPETMAAKIAFNTTNRRLTDILKNAPNLSDQELVLALVVITKNNIISSKPNYFLTISMEACFSKYWKNYNRDYHTAQLFQKTVVLLKKLFLHFDEGLAKISYEKWPFFYATMEHFNEKGELVAPHIHILFKHQASIDVLRTIIRQIWSEAIGRVGPFDIDLRPVTTKTLAKRAQYILKNSFRDGLDLEGNVDKLRLCQINGWSEQALDHDRWRIDRKTFRNALKDNRHALLKKKRPLSNSSERQQELEKLQNLIKML